MPKAVIDADFFIKLTQNELSANVFLRIIKDLQITPVMHKYVYRYELRNTPYVQNLVDKKIIEIYDHKDYLITEQDHKEYKKYFYDIYEQMSEYTLPKGTDIYTYQAAGENLGEIRSIYLALKMNIPYFASDDGGALSAVKYVSTSKHQLKTLSVVDAIRKCKENGSDLCWKDLRCCIPAAYREDHEKVAIIKAIVDAKYEMSTQQDNASPAG